MVKILLKLRSYENSDDGLFLSVSHISAGEGGWRGDQKLHGAE